MFWPKIPKERERYYLLPGMGGKGMRRKRRVILAWSIAVGALASAVLVGILYWVNQRR